MRACLLVVLAVAHLASGQLPDCSKPFVVMDPSTQQKYSYDLSKAAVSLPAQLIGGWEYPATFTMYINICGNASIVPNSCISPTPVCMVDQGAGYDCGGAGGPANWQVGPYYDPTTPTKLIYNGGVVVVAGGGGGCVGGTVTRTTTLWLKCDPTVLALPQIGSGVCYTSPSPCVTIQESSVCQYGVSPIPWIGFCPLGSVAPPSGIRAIANATLCVAASSSSASPQAAVIATLYPNPWVQLPNWSCANSNGFVVCSGNVPSTPTCVAAQYASVNVAGGVYEAMALTDTVCDTKSAGSVYTVDPSAGSFTTQLGSTNKFRFRNAASPPADVYTIAVTSMSCVKTG